MKIETFLIAIGLFSMVAVVFLAATANITTNYASEGVTVAIDENMSQTYSQASQINNLSLEMEETLRTASPGTLGAVSAFLSAAWSTVILSFSSLAMSITLISNSATLFGLPPEITMFLVSAVILTLVITIAYLIFGMQRD
jgi:hypothetical protein